MITLIKTDIKVERYLFAKVLKVWDIAKLFYKIFNVVAQHRVPATSACGRRGVGRRWLSCLPGCGSRLAAAFFGRQTPAASRHNFAGSGGCRPCSRASGCGGRRGAMHPCEASFCPRRRSWCVLFFVKNLWHSFFFSTFVRLLRDTISISMPLFL